MRYLKDYKKMLESNYINDSLLGNVKDDTDFTVPINLLLEELKKISEKNSAIIEEALKIMSELACYNEALKMKVRINVLNDPKNKEKKYLQARGAVPYEKGSRIWAGFYLGPAENFVGGKMNEDAIKEGRIGVLHKVVEGLKTANGL